jgi:hypothetical protein
MATDAERVGAPAVAVQRIVRPHGHRLQSNKFYIYLFNSKTYQVKDRLTLDNSLLNRPDAINASLDMLIKKHKGIQADEEIRITRQNPSELCSPCEW